MCSPLERGSMPVADTVAHPQVSSDAGLYGPHLESSKLMAECVFFKVYPSEMRLYGCFYTSQHVSCSRNRQDPVPPRLSVSYHVR